MKNKSLKSLLALFLLMFAFTLIPINVYAAPKDEEETEEEGDEEEQEIDPSEYVIELPVTPNVYLAVFTDYEWYNGQYAIAHIYVHDVANSNDFTVSTIRAKFGANGTYFDITQDQQVVLSENTNLYIKITDTNNNVYEKSVNITCFDYVKPTLNAAVVEGVLRILPYDDLSGIRAVYVNGYEFTPDDFVRGELNIRLEQFDGTYPYFSMQAIDNASNLSQVYTVANPFYVAPDDLEDGEAYPYMQLPVSALPSAPTTATGDVTEHMEVDENGDMIAPIYNSDKGKSFYTINTETGKVFYLVVDRDGNTETVYFLTEISENDLLNVTSDTNATLKYNSIAKNNNVNTSENVNDGRVEVTADSISETQEAADRIDNRNQPTQTTDTTPSNQPTTVSANNVEPSFVEQHMDLVLIGGGSIVFFFILYFVKIKGKKNTRKMTDEAIDDEEDDDDEIDEEE